MTSKEAVEHFRRKAQKEEIRALLTSGEDKEKHLRNALVLTRMAERFTGFGVQTAAFTSGGTIRR